jgi:hypothetical protein
MSAPRANKYSGTCLLRKARTPRVTTYDSPGGLRTSVSYWEVVHRPARWVGSPVSGNYVGGCPEELAS